MSKDNIELKDVIHLYVGCEALFEAPSEGWRDEMTLDNLVTHLNRNHTIKPILRKLDSMTEEERKERQSYINMHSSDLIIEIKREAAATAFLLSKGFDLFNLIENNLAIDKNAKQ